MDKKRIYISGKISGDEENFAQKFAAKEKELTEQGYLVFNPVKHPDMFTWEQFLELDLLALKFCDSVYFLNDWKDSRGAKIEYDEAVKLGKELLFESNEKVQKVAYSKKTPFTTNSENTQNSSAPDNLSSYFKEFSPSENIIERIKDVSLLIMSDEKLEIYQKIGKLSEIRVGLSNNRSIVGNGEKMNEIFKPSDKMLSDYIKTGEEEIFSDFIENTRLKLPTKDWENRNVILNISSRTLATFNDSEKIIINKQLQSRGVNSEEKLFKFLKKSMSPKKMQKSSLEIER